MQTSSGKNCNGGAKLPAADLADLAQRHEVVLQADIGSVRASTIRKRVRGWRKFRILRGNLSVSVS